MSFLCKDLCILLNQYVYMEEINVYQNRSIHISTAWQIIINHSVNHLSVDCTVWSQSHTMNKYCLIDQWSFCLLFMYNFPGLVCQSSACPLLKQFCTISYQRQSCDPIIIGKKWLISNYLMWDYSRVIYAHMWIPLKSSCKINHIL